MDDPVYESQLQEKLAELTRPFADIDANVFGPYQLRTLKGRLEQAGFEDFAQELRLVGLGNIRARLQQLYPDDHAFQLADGPQCGTVATLSLPLRSQDETTDSQTGTES